MNSRESVTKFFFPLWRKNPEKSSVSSFPTHKMKYVYAERLIQSGFLVEMYPTACPIYLSNLLHDVKFSLSENKYFRASSSQKLRCPKISINLEGNGWLAGDPRAMLQRCVWFLGKLVLRFLQNKPFAALQSHSFTSLFIFMHLFLHSDLCHSFILFYFQFVSLTLSANSVQPSMTWSGKWQGTWCPRPGIILRSQTRA